MSEKIFKALSDPTRLKIIKLLKKKEICACEFVANTNKAQPTVSSHLRVLENAKIVKKRKEGKKILYTLTDMKILDLIKTAEKLGKLND